MTTIRRLAVLLLVFLLWAPAAYAWSWPVQGPVVQPFSYDEAHPYAAGQHRGVDIGADATGESVVAPAAGTVSFAGTVPTNGKTITIETPDGYSVTLTHLGSIGVAKGTTVAEQEAVGTIGPSGTPEVDGPYVHLGIRVTADPSGYVDPLSLLPPAAGDPPTETGTTTTQPVSTGASSTASANKPASSKPARTRVANSQGSSAESAESHVQVQEHEPVQRPHADVRTTRSPQRPAVRDSVSEPTSSLRRPFVEPATSGPVSLNVGHEHRPTASPVPSNHEPSSPLPALVCNWAAALFALGAALLARRRRSTVTAQVLHLPSPEAGVRRASRAA